jgi:flagellar M-ring protein FliF
MLQTAAGPETNEETANVVTSNVVPHSTTRIMQHGLTPKNVTVQVGIPTTYYEKVWLERNPPVAGQPVKKPDANAIKDIETKVKIDVERAVVALLPPVPPTVDRFPRVDVTSFQPIATQAITGPTLPDKALAWLGQYWTTLGMTGVALFSLILLRGMIQAVPVAASPAASAAASPGLSLVTPDEPELEPQAAEGSSARSRLKRRGASGPSLRDELAEIVKEDPDAAVAILRNWIGSAS